jgi:MFS family permease
MGDPLRLRHDPYAALRIREFSFFISARFFLTLGIQMQGVIISWQIKELTGSFFHSGMIGLAEALPMMITSLFSGYVADKVSRKKIVLISGSFYALSILALYFIASNTGHILTLYGLTPIYLVIVATGIIRGFIGAALPSYMAQIVPRELYTNAATWNSTVWHIGFITGNAVGGLLCAVGVPFAYSIDAAIVMAALAFFVFIASRPIPPMEKEERFSQRISSGLRFVFKNQFLLGALTLDLFAVLFGGATALLPFFASDVLGVGALGFGFLRAAPAIGAVIMAFWLAYRPPRKNAGRNLFISVAFFGFFTILFALSENYILSFILLLITGAFDNVSVVVRHTILQLMTPDHMRGRVSAVNNIFIGSSNEIGAFESGIAAELMGLVPSVVFGGAMTMLVVLITMRLAPKLAKLDMSKI